MGQSRTRSDVGATGFERQSIPAGKPGNVIPEGAECGTLHADSTASTPDAGLAGGADPLLGLVIEAWSTLTAEERPAIVERIATKLCASSDAPRRCADESAPRSGETNFRRRGTHSAPRLAHDADQHRRRIAAAAVSRDAWTRWPPARAARLQLVGGGFRRAAKTTKRSGRKRPPESILPASTAASMPPSLRRTGGRRV